jgi:hypothetical protein
MYMSGLPFWFDASTSLVRHALGRCEELYLGASSAKAQVAAEARVYLALYLACAAAAGTTPLGPMHAAPSAPAAPASPCAVPCIGRRRYALELTACKRGPAAAVPAVGAALWAFWVPAQSTRASCCPVRVHAGRAFFFVFGSPGSEPARGCCRCSPR